VKTVINLQNQKCRKYLGPMVLKERKNFVYKIKHHTRETKLPFKRLHKKLCYALLCEFQITTNFLMLHFWLERISDFGNMA